MVLNSLSIVKQILYRGHFSLPPNSLGKTGGGVSTELYFIGFGNFVEVDISRHNYGIVYLYFIYKKLYFICIFNFFFGREDRQS